ncbi:MAG: polynucleotide adenylyltransferase, partial [Acutalibacteraceae bacterium]
ILKRLKFSNSFSDTVITLIKYHDLRVPPIKRSIKKVLLRIGVENFRLLLKVQRADLLAQSDYRREEKNKRIDDVTVLLEEILQEKEVYSLEGLAINGNDLISIGISNGKEIGYILDLLLKYVIEDNSRNKKELLIKKAMEIYKSRLSL